MESWTWNELSAELRERVIRIVVEVRPGAAPSSVVALHNIHLTQVRAAFVGMNYYPALLGASGLGERILNQLVLTLRRTTPTTRQPSTFSTSSPS
jgi:hypothetical protein